MLVPAYTLEARSYSRSIHKLLDVFLPLPRIQQLNQSPMGKTGQESGPINGSERRMSLPA